MAHWSGGWFVDRSRLFWGSRWDKPCLRRSEEFAHDAPFEFWFSWHNLKNNQRSQTCVPWNRQLCTYYAHPWIAHSNVLHQRNWLEMARLDQKQSVDQQCQQCRCCVKTAACAFCQVSTHDNCHVVFDHQERWSCHSLQFQTPFDELLYRWCGRNARAM